MKADSIKVAVLGDTSTQFLTQALRGAGLESGFDFQIWEAGFNQVESQVFDTDSELYAFNPEVIIIYQSSQKLLEEYNKLNPDDYSLLAKSRMEMIHSLSSGINARLNARIIYYNYSEIDDAIYGNYTSKREPSFLFQLRKLNYELMIYCQDHPGFYLCDLSGIQNQLGKSGMFRPSIYINTEMVMGTDALPLIANRTTALIGAIYGKLKKCLILDLDNTLWGGTIGDDGLENIQIGDLGIGKAFTEFQYWIKKLKNRGIILAVCSKNTESIAKEPFEKHPEMVLRLEDIAIFKANWENKITNIRQIQQALNIDFDTMVFLDDNPVERNMVREYIPAITVPELPEDPADYLEYLYSLNLFETASYSNEDAERTSQYQTEINRHAERQQYFNEEEFLESLHMTSAPEPFNAFNSPRISQLSQRSNQFNLRTSRYTTAEIEKHSTSPGIFTYSFTLEDKFGQNGIVCLIILKKETSDTLFIDSWIMSCRILKRGMEVFTLNTIVQFGKKNGYRWLKGEYLPTKKNEIVKDHYQKSGFQEKDGYWLLDMHQYQNGKTYISLK